MKKIFIAVWLSAILPVAVFAYFDGGIGTVSGSSGYSGLNGFVEIGLNNGWYVKPAVSTYKADYSGGTLATYSGRLGYDSAVWGAGAEAGVTPKVNGYKNTFVNGDITFSISPAGGKQARLTGPRRSGAGAKGEGLSRIDVGAALAYTMHSSDFDSAGATLADPFKVNQTDLSLFAGVLFLQTQVSGRYTKNLGYSKTLTPADRDPLKVDIPGMISSTIGFVNQTWNARIDWSMLPVVSPFFSYTYIQYKLAHPSSKSYLLGASAGLKMINIDVAYQIFDPGQGFDSQNYFSVGAGLKF